jgi:hypothetical protein
MCRMTVTHLLKRCVLSWFFLKKTVKWQLINCQMTLIDYCNCSQLEIEFEMA